MGGRGQAVVALVVVPVVPDGYQLSFVFRSLVPATSMPSPNSSRLQRGPVQATGRVRPVATWTGRVVSSAPREAARAAVLAAASPVSAGGRVMRLRNNKSVMLTLAAVDLFRVGHVRTRDGVFGVGLVHVAGG